MRVSPEALAIAALAVASVGAVYAAKAALGLDVRNTVIYWWMLAASAYLSARFAGSLYWTPLAFLLLFAALELVFFGLHVPVWNENEKVRNIYNMMYRFLDDDGKHTQAADLSEGYFKCDYAGTSAEQAMRNKYDAIYDMLQLKPGMRVMDLGCGHGQWMRYLRERGVSAVGATLSNEQHENLTRQGFEVHLGDFTRLPQRFEGAFDAVTAIGSFEHLPKNWMSHARAQGYVTRVMQRHQRLFDPRSPCKRLFVSVITFDSRYIDWSLVDHISFYLLERTTSGYYFHDFAFKDMAEATLDYRTEAIANLTEDYRYVSIVNESHFGDAALYSKLTLAQVLYFASTMLYDPFWPQRLACAFFAPWMWQFGGNSREVIPNQTPRPCMLGWYLFKHEPSGAKKAFAGTCNSA